MATTAKVAMDGGGPVPGSTSPSNFHLFLHAKNLRRELGNEAKA